MDPTRPRAHYYLGTDRGDGRGRRQLDEAITEFRQELKIAPGDPLATLRLGMALVEARRDAEALPLLQKAVATPSPSPDAWLYLGRCQLALGRPADAIASFRRALDTALQQTEERTGAEQSRSRSIHYQLGIALRADRRGRGGRARVRRSGAAVGRAHRNRSRASSRAISRMRRIPTAAPGAGARGRGFEKLTPAERGSDRVDGPRHARARVPQPGHHPRAGAAVRARGRAVRARRGGRPAFPQVQYSLGVALLQREAVRQGSGRARSRARSSPRATRTCAACWRWRR